MGEKITPNESPTGRKTMPLHEQHFPKQRVPGTWSVDFSKMERELEDTGKAYDDAVRQQQNTRPPTVSFTYDEVVHLLGKEAVFAACS